MSKDLNRCDFIGRLGKDVETRFTPDGKAIASFSIACSDDYKDKQGNKVEQTEWVNISAFGKLAEICAQYLKKGSRVYCSGKFNTRKWQDNDGNDRYSTGIKLVDMQMLDTKSDSQSSNFSQAPAQPQTTTTDFEDDIPFQLS